MYTAITELRVIARRRCLSRRCYSSRTPAPPPPASRQLLPSMKTPTQSQYLDHSTWHCTRSSCISQHIPYFEHLSCGYPTWSRSFFKFLLFLSAQGRLVEVDEATTDKRANVFTWGFLACLAIGSLLRWTAHDQFSWLLMPSKRTKSHMIHPVYSNDVFFPTDSINGISEILLIDALS